MNIDPAIFNLLLQALKKNKEIHLNIVWGTLAFQVAAIGWLITSEQARDLFGSKNTLRIVGTIAVVMLALAHYGMLYDTYDQSEKLVDAMESNEYFQKVLLNERLTFSSFQIDQIKPIVRGIFTLVLFGVLIFTFWYCKRLVGTKKNQH